MEDTCPFNDNGQHRYFIYRVVDEYVPTAEGFKLWEKIEYAFMGCNCGSAIKQRVKQA